MDRKGLVALIQRLGGLEKADSDIITERVKPGHQPALAGLSKEELAQADRFSQGAVTRREDGPITAALTVPFAGAYEGTKGLAQSDALLGPTGIPGLAKLLLEAFGPEFEVDDTTSPASLDNVLAYAKGAFTGEDELAPPAVAAPPTAVDPRTGRPNAPAELDPAIAAFLRSRGKQ